MYSLTRFWIGRNEARRLTQVSVVVSTTRTSDSPSTPTRYLIPNSGIQSCSSTSWKPGVEDTNATRSAMDTTHAASANPSAT
jgi:hypothetical protein